MKSLKSNRLSHLANGETFPTPAQAKARAALEAQQNSEQDLHIWAKPETEYMSALYTVSIGKRSLCHDLPLERALDVIGDHLREMGACV